MSYKSWIAGLAGTGTAGYDLPYEVTDGFPLDFRTVKQSFSEVLDVSTNVRYPGLTVYNTEDGIEYTYIPNANKLFSKSNVVEYHPELVHFGTSLSATPPTQAADLKAVMGDNVRVGDDNETVTTYNTIPEGAEGTLKTADNKYYKYVWNGSEWVMFANSGSGGSNAVTLNFASDIDVSGDSDSPVYLSSIYALNSNYISNAYKEAMGLDVNDTIASGSEANVVFTDKTTDPYVEYCRKYVYLNGAWRIVQGVQEYVITLPAYAEDEWYDGYNPKNGMVIEPNDDSVNVDVMVASNKGTVDVIISHQFNSQYVDAFVFEKNETSEDIDGGASPETEYGDRLLVPVTCFKSVEDNKFKVKISLPVSNASTTTYAITLQK